MNTSLDLELELKVKVKTNRIKNPIKSKSTKSKIPAPPSPADVVKEIVKTIPAEIKTINLPKKEYNFKIEVVKWKWLDTVKSPNVYRDDEFVRSQDKEEALEAVKYLLNKPYGLTYVITVKRDGEYFSYYRKNMPCYGGLVKYSDSHGKDKYWMNPYFPRDIYVAFPEGEIIFIGLNLNGQNLLNGKNPYFDFIFSEESPWVSAFNNKESIVVGSNYFILTDMETNPTVLYHMLRYGDIGYGHQITNLHPKVDILLGKTGSCDPRRLAGQKPIVFKNNWKSGHGYVRPWNESIYKTKLPVQLKDFHKLPKNQYPPTFPFTNEYFVKTMKEKFGVDINNKNQKLYDGLLESWDFFKNEAAGLGDE